LVVLAGRDRLPMQEAEYWLRLIRTYGKASTVVIVLNKIKEHHFTLDEFNLKDRYSEVKAVVAVDCNPRYKITELKKLLGTLAGKMPSVRERIDPAWANVRTELEKMDASYVCYADYQEICTKFGVNTPEQQDTLATILNCLGIALNYRTDSRLQDKSVLKPRWLVDGIYTILRWLQKHKTNGVLKLADFGKALKDKKTYPLDMHEFLLALMEKFELCFPLEKSVDGKAYLVPELLNENQPQEMKKFMESKAQRIQLRYDDLRPPGLLPRFIVRSNTLSVGQPRWRHGVVLARGKAYALVRGDHAGRVTDIFAIGETEDRIWLTEFVLGEMKVLNDKLPVKTLIASEAQSGAWTELEILRAADLKGEQTRAEQTSDRGTVQVNVKQTLREVESPEASKPRDNPLSLFICYAHANERLVKQLKPSLTVLARRGYIAPWRDTDLVPGEDWDETIKGKLSNAQMILFMVSRQFLASHYITTEERPLAMRLMAEKKAVVLPVLLLPCSWKAEDFARLEKLPRKDDPVSSFNPRDQAWALAEEGIVRAVEKFRASRKESPLMYEPLLGRGLR
jgi:internalin A